MPDIGVRVLGLDVPNVLEPIGLEGYGRLIWSSLLLVVGCVVVFVMARRPKSPEPSTWAATILGAVLVYALMTLGYAIVPHEWLTAASKELNWGKDTFFWKAQDSIFPFDFPRAALADIIAVGIYVVVLVVNVALFVMWQNRPVRATDGEEASAERVAKGTSAFGRPVTVTE